MTDERVDEQTPPGDSVVDAHGTVGGYSHVGARCDVPRCDVPRCDVPLRDDSECRHRRSIRLRGYDYTQAGAYFVTICTQDRACLFGEIIDGQMRLNAAGHIVHDEWLRTEALRPNVELDAFVVMPNHFHGIIVLDPDCGDTLDGRGTLLRAPLQRAPTVEQFGKPTSNSIPTIVRLFKSASTKRINELRATPGARVWQRNYYEHIIRSEESLNRIREYITNNPMQWEWDRENALAIQRSPQPKDEPWHI